jgi:hypothetical protein
MSLKDKNMSTRSHGHRGYTVHNQTKANGKQTNPSKAKGISRTSHSGVSLRVPLRRRFTRVCSRPLPPPMDPPAGGSADRRGNGPGPGAALSGLRRYGLNFSASSLLQAPIAALLEYSGVVPSGPAPQPVHPSAAPSSPSSSSEVDGLLSPPAAGDGEVSIRIQGGPGDPEAASGASSSSEDSIEATASSEVDQASSVAGRGGGGADAEANGGTSGGAGTAGNGAGDRVYQRYDVHHVARWIEQILPFSLLLLVVFIRQHLQGLCIFLSFSKYCNAVRLKHPCVQIFYLVRLLNKPRSLE